MIRPSAFAAILLVAVSLVAQPVVVGPPRRVTPDLMASASGRFAAIVEDGDRTVLFWWKTNDRGSARLLARRIDNEGRSTTPDVEITADATYAWEPGIARVPNGDFFIVWPGQAGVIVGIAGPDLRLKSQQLVSSDRQGIYDVACNASRCAVVTRRGVVDVAVTVFDHTGVVVGGPYLLAFAESAAVAAGRDGFAVAIAKTNGSIALIDNSGMTTADVPLGKTWTDIDIVAEPSGYLAAYSIDGGIRLLPISNNGLAGTAVDLALDDFPNEIALARNGAEHLLLYSRNIYPPIVMEGTMPDTVLRGVRFTDPAAASLPGTRINALGATEYGISVVPAAADFLAAWQTFGEGWDAGIVVRGRPLSPGSELHFVESQPAGKQARDVAVTGDAIGVLWHGKPYRDAWLMLSVLPRNNDTIPPPLFLSPSTMWGASITTDGRDFLVARVDLPVTTELSEIKTTLTLVDGRNGRATGEIRTSGIQLSPPIWTGSEYAIVVTRYAPYSVRIIRIAGDLSRIDDEVVLTEASTAQAAALAATSSRIVVVWADDSPRQATIARAFTPSFRQIGEDQRVLDSPARQVRLGATAESFVLTALRRDGSLVALPLDDDGRRSTAPEVVLAREVSGWPDITTVRICQGTLISWASLGTYATTSAFLPDGSAVAIRVNTEGQPVAGSALPGGYRPVLLFGPAAYQDPVMVRDVMQSVTPRRRAVR